MRLPNRAKVRAIARAHATKDSEAAGKIHAHSLIVGDVAVGIGKQLKDRGHEVNLRLLRKAALLHDIKKHEGMGHAQSAAKIVEVEGYPELARVISSHDIRDFGERTPHGMSLEEVLFLYADFRTGSRYQALEKRHDVLKARYPSDVRAIHNTFNRLKEFEAWLRGQGVDPEAAVQPRRGRDAHPRGHP